MPENQTPVKDPKTILIIVLLLAVVVLGILFVTRKPEQQVIYRTDPAQQSQRKSEVTPYVRNEVNNTIAKKWKELNGCYNQFLASEPTPTVTDGKVVVDWQVEADGTPVNPEVVSSEINHPVLEKCLVAQINEWKFPPPPPSGRNEYVVYKFFFKKEVPETQTDTSTPSVKAPVVDSGTNPAVPAPVVPAATNPAQ
ncbi:MAG: AgmX/PglI C-terminal domain-containing protein [SAR324 cluster bacterium]|nr:AgmX/PglI C-terminal domain-containing protein [SAR324 cluster bacterium]